MAESESWKSSRKQYHDKATSNWHNILWPQSKRARKEHEAPQNKSARHIKRPKKEIQATPAEEHVKTSTVVQEFEEIHRLNPWCPHGPTLQFERGGTKRFYACSAFRQRKDCSAFFESGKICFYNIPMSIPSICYLIVRLKRLPGVLTIIAKVKFRRLWFFCIHRGQLY